MRAYVIKSCVCAHVLQCVNDVTDDALRYVTTLTAAAAAEAAATVTFVQWLNRTRSGDYVSR